MASIIDEDGIWSYDPVTDKMTRIGDAPKKNRTSSSGSFDPWSYKGIRYELDRATGGLDDEYIGSNNLINRINSITDPSERNELRGLLERRRAEYIRNRENKEKRIAAEDAAEHNRLVQKYNSEWKKRNVLWRVFHQKLSPKKQNFDLYTEDTIKYEIDKVRRK